MFGAPMRFTTDKGVRVIMRPPREEEAERMAWGFSQYAVTKYLAHTRSYTVADEYAWIEESRTNAGSSVWALAVVTDDGPECGMPIGTTSYSHQDGIGCSGSVIYDTNYWGQGIVSAAHRARTYYAFRVHNLLGLNSDVLHPNHGSRRALEKAGYVVTGMRPHGRVVEGQLCHELHLTVVHPDELAWKYFWRDSDRQLDPALREAFVEARGRTAACLKWAETQVVME